MKSPDSTKKISKRRPVLLIDLNLKYDSIQKYQKGKSYSSKKSLPFSSIHIRIWYQKNLAFHFKDDGHPRAIIYSYMSKYKDFDNITFKKNLGRTTVVSSSETIKKVQDIFKRNPSITIVAAAKKLGISPSTLSRIKVKKRGIKDFTKIIVPSYVKDQENRAKTTCRKICDALSRKVAL